VTTANAVLAPVATNVRPPTLAFIEDSRWDDKRGPNAARIHRGSSMLPIDDDRQTIAA